MCCCGTQNYGLSPVTCIARTVLGDGLRWLIANGWTTFSKHRFLAPVVFFMFTQIYMGASSFKFKILKSEIHGNSLYRTLRCVWLFKVRWPRGGVWVALDLSPELWFLPVSDADRTQNVTFKSRTFYLPTQLHISCENFSKTCQVCVECQSSDLFSHKHTLTALGIFPVWHLNTFLHSLLFPNKLVGDLKRNSFLHSFLTWHAQRLAS